MTLARGRSEELHPQTVERTGQARAAMARLDWLHYNAHRSCSLNERSAHQPGTPIIRRTLVCDTEDERPYLELARPHTLAKGLLGRKDLALMPADVTKNGPRIVVGVDGSPSSRAALRWAVRYAALTGGTTDAIMAVHNPTTLATYPWASLDETDDLDENALKALDGVVKAEVEADDSHLVGAEVINGHPAAVLLHAAADADLLVVGSSGHGRFAEALLGSVSQHVVHHAQCPVLIMRERHSE